MAKEDLENGVGCRVLGSFEIDKVSGNFHFSFHAFMPVFFALRQSHHEAFMKLNLSYEIETLRFGNTEETAKISDIRKIISDMELEEQLFENFVDHKRNSYEQFIAGFWLELFPYTLIDHRTGLTFRSLQHSFNRKIKVN
jgi:hypothetical protein